MKIHEALEIVRGEVVAFTGAGGKTALLVGVGYELAENGWRVLATSTVDIEAHQLDLLPHALPLSAGFAAISDALTEHKFVFLYNHIQQGIVHGVAPHTVPHLLDALDSDVLLIEADKADGLPLKAPLPGEPVVPPGTSLVVSCVSLRVLGQPLDDAHIYNPAAMIERFGFGEGQRVKSAWVAQVMRDEALGLHGVPPGVRLVGFLNQLPPQGYGRGRARLIAKLALRSPRFHAVAIGSARGAELVQEVQRPVGAVVLAAGLSTRMGGGSKVLLPWSDGRTIIEHIVDQLLRARIDHITVVTGHLSRQVKQLLKPLEVETVYNRHYRTGEMLSSLQTGVAALPANIAAALVVLGDQPRIQPKVIYQVMSAYAEGHGDLIVPSFERQRGHPVLIGRRYWQELLALDRNATPRALFNAHADRIHYVSVDTDTVLRDVDTPQDYESERRSGF